VVSEGRESVWEGEGGEGDSVWDRGMRGKERGERESHPGRACWNFIDISFFTHTAPMNRILLSH
jgi:hypothetical protein